MAKLWTYRRRDSRLAVGETRDMGSAKVGASGATRDADRPLSPDQGFAEEMIGRTEIPRLAKVSPAFRRAMRAP